MFAVSSAKRIGRDELLSLESSPRSSPDPAITELLRSRTHNEYAFTSIGEESNNEGKNGSIDEVDEDEAELILFAATTNATISHKIRLSSPVTGTGEAGIAFKRPRSYYFADDITGDKEAELSAAAVTGKKVKEMGRVPWPGCALPWKVTFIMPAGVKKEVLVGHHAILVAGGERGSKRRRKSKKARIALRKKMQARRDKEAEKARLKAKEEEAYREKKTRRNREKKVKKKMRDKAKKETAVENGAKDE